MPNYCIKPWSWPTLRHDGTLFACECDHARERVIGNVFSADSFRKVWRSEEAASVRRPFSKSGIIDTDFCRRCRYKLDDAIRTATFFSG